LKNNRIVIFGWADSVHVQRWCTGLTKRGFSIKLISVVGAPLDSVETVILSRSSKLSYVTNLSRAKKEANAFSPDLIHVHYVAGNGLLGLWSKIRPMVSSVWGSDIYSYANSWPVNCIVNKVLKKSDHITVTSQYLKTETEKRLNGHMRPITVIPFGIELPIEDNPVPGPRPFRICHLKDHKPVYGADILIKALSTAIKAVPDIFLTIAGKENDYTVYLKRLVTKYNLEKHVSFAGHINHEKVYSFISTHHLMVMPSRSEGFGVAAVEASACARPVIATNVGGIPEIVIDQKTGILVTSDDPKALAEAILKLANNIDLCDKMGREGREFVRQSYQWERSLDLMSQLYERLIDESHKS